MVAMPEADIVIANPTRILFDTTRGSPNEPVIEHRERRTRFLLIEIAVPPEAKEVSLEFDDGTRSSLDPAGDGFDSLLVPRSVIERGALATLHYELDGNKTSLSIALNQKQGAIGQ
jgi:hypothetical protein